MIKRLAVNEILDGMVYVLDVIRKYVSFSVEVSKGGRPTNKAYLKAKKKDNQQISLIGFVRRITESVSPRNFG